MKSGERVVIESLTNLFVYYKQLGDKAMAQVTRDEDFYLQPKTSDNSIAIIVQHIWGNMLSRWTNFTTEDGEKPWRERDAEFEDGGISRQELMVKWDAGWTCLFEALSPLRDQNLNDIVYIRNEGHSVQEAIHRQLAHYAYHVGQIVLLAKMYAPEWKTLSIAKGASTKYNERKFGDEQVKRHFTEELIKKPKA